MLGNQRTLVLRDHAPQFDKLGDVLSHKHLDRLVFVQLVLDLFDGKYPKEKMVYFLENRRTYKLSAQDLQQDMERA